ncbi:ComF family protein [Parasediminibacterium sp. JCM 36343]|uniref:ComF family protein n=1 Tax=Parasediminibacterium sp. JCM 36343 TaxID=3374279 RepID=UPI00397E335F
MLTTIKSYLSDFTHLLYPHNCEGCGTDVLDNGNFLCAKCFYELPETGFFTVADNPVEKKFYGRLKVEQAASSYYFTKNSLLQRLVYELKYKGNMQMGLYLGKLVGYQLQDNNRFDAIEALVPMPLNAKREKKRGYNQAQLICEGIASVWQKPIISHAVSRAVATTTQTKQNISSRWENVDGAFAISNADALKGKHIALVDDVITTGASVEACGSEMVKIPGVRLSVIGVGFTI